MKKLSLSNKFFSFYFIAVAVLISFMIGLIVGNHPVSDVVDVVNGSEVSGVGDVPEYLTKDVDFNLFWDAWDIITKNYVDQPVNESKLLYGAIAGLVNSLEDPHSIFLNPELNESFLQELNGSFFGIGAEISVKASQLQIVAPLPDTPAEKGGLRAGDYIITIDGEDTAFMPLDEAVSKIRGEKGSDVVLGIFRNGFEEPKDFIITRDEIKITSVKWEMLDNNIAYIELRYFNVDTAKEFSKIVNEIVKADPDYIILDLRNNPGGFLDVSVDIASEFIEDGVVVSERAYDGSINENKARGRAKLKDYPITVLINEGSASASEILAGALQDYGLAKIVGMQSFGKGSVQTIFDLKDGSSIKLTIAKWLTPKGNTIEGEGITPDVEVDLTLDDFNNDRDPQLDKAIELILNPDTADNSE